MNIKTKVIASLAGIACITMVVGACAGLPSDVERSLSGRIEGIYFESSSAKVKAESFDRLDTIASLMIKYPNVKLVIEGYTDNQGAKEANLDLSLKRARSVKKYMEEKGVAPSRLKAVGFGELHPLASNKSSEGRALNRRIEFKITSK